MKKRIIILSSIVVAIIVLLIVAQKSGGKKDNVQAEKMVNRTIVETVSANGKIQPETEVKISADVSGEITDLYVEEGDTVKPGMLLLTIDQDLYLTAVDRAKANVNSSKSTLNTNKALLTQSESRFVEISAIYKRNTQLFKEGVLSQAEYDNVTTNFEVAKGEIKASKERVLAAQYGVQNAQATLKEALKNLSRTKIYSPTLGVVSKLNNEKGERVVGTAQMQGTEIMVLSNFNNMEVQVDVNENDILAVEKGDTTIIEVDAYNEREFKGVVTEISKSAIGNDLVAMSADQITNFKVKIRILKSSYQDLLEVTDAPFLRGMSASVEVQTKIERSIPTLPIEAVTTRSIEDTLLNEKSLEEVVFIVEDGLAKMKEVKTGVQDNRYIQIVEGLSDSVKAIVGPYDAVSKKLEDGDKVEITAARAISKDDK